MSIYGWFACQQCRTCLGLGKWIRDADERTIYFQSGYTPNSAQPDRTRALWKFLADHATHPLVVLLPGVPGYDDLDEYCLIGGDRIQDVPFDEYLKEWPG